MGARQFASGALLAAAIVPAAAHARPTPSGCEDLAAVPKAITDRARSLEAEDLIGLTDIGDPSPTFESAGLELSPDGRFVAFPVRRAHAAANSYCLGIMLLDRSNLQTPRLLDRSDELVWTDFDDRGVLEPHDYPRMIRPKWSPDGKWLVYEKSVANVIQLWRINIADGRALPVPGVAGPIQNFIWSDPRTIVVATRSGVADAKAAIGREALTGYHFDARFKPNLDEHPLPLTPMGTDVRAIAVETGLGRPATKRERALLAPAKPGDARLAAQGTGDALAWTFDLHQRYASPTGLRVRFRGGRPLTCDETLCDRITGLWWSRDGQRLVFTRDDGWGKSQTGIYVWRQGRTRPARILLTDDLLLDCKLATDNLLCARETSLEPRTIVDVTLQGGATRVIYDPNPGFALLSKGRVERLHWTDPNGTQSYADLVYPVRYHAGTRYPTIVTSYNTRGFLRGATGDEYPIQLFANHGYAVFSFRHPPSSVKNLPNLPDGAAATSLMYRDWGYRRDVHAAMEAGLQLLDDRGVRDPARTGMTGLSDGTSAVQFSLLNSRIFSAAIMSSCCQDIDALMTANGLSTGDYFRSIGFPALDDPQLPFWSAMSLTLGARRMNTPLLIQMPGDEFRMALSPYTALRERHQPVDMFVYPGEGHVKAQPAHRLAIYRRNLAWFDFWLKGDARPATAFPDDLPRWQALRAGTLTAGTALAAP